jgi:hypothetical protein
MWGLFKPTLPNYKNNTLFMGVVVGVLVHPTGSEALGRSLAPGRLSIHLYPSRIAMQECVVRERCPAFRSINLLPRTGNGVYRSYFLSEMDRKMIAQHCVTAKGKWHPDTTCYTVD